MNVLFETTGQTCNQFWQYLYYLKKCYLGGKKIYILLPDKTIGDYPNLTNNDILSYPLYSKHIAKVIGTDKCVKLARNICHYLFNSHFQPIWHFLSFRRVNFLSGREKWNVDEDYSMLRTPLKTLFDIKPDLKKDIDPIFDDINTLYIGVHIRWGDYRRWLNGKYYFDMEVYLKYMKSFISLSGSCKKIKFILCCNEKIDERELNDIDYYISTGTASQDLYLLSKCNYIIGTLSSYNAWVSFLYSIPLYTILDANSYETMDLDDFGVVENYVKKSNGWRFPRKDSFFRTLNPKLYKYSHNKTSE